MNRNSQTRRRGITGMLALGCGLAILGAGCQHRSLLTDPEILEKTAAKSHEKEALVLQASNWEKPELPEPGTPHGDLHIAEALFRAEDYAQAARAFEEVADKHKNAPDVHERALFMRAEAEFQQGLYAEARDSFQDFRKAYPGSRLVSDAMKRLFAISDTWLEDARRDIRQGKPSSVHRFVNVAPDRKPLFDIDGHAIETLKYVRENDPNGPLADDSLMMAAGYEYAMGNYQEADQLTDQLIHSYPHSDFQAKAHLMNAEAKIQSYKGAPYDGRKLEEARRTLKSAVAQFQNELEPERQRIIHELEDIRQEQAKAQFEVAEWYRRMGDRTPKKSDTYYRAARLYYQYVQRNFPGTKWAERADEHLQSLPIVPPAAAKSNTEPPSDAASDPTGQPSPKGRGEP